MLTRWSDIDRLLGWADTGRTISSLEQLRRQMERWFDAADTTSNGQWFTGWPRTSLYDGGAELIVTAEVPGMTHDELDVTVHQDVLTIKGERKVETPEGYVVHRRERAPYQFARSLSLPYKVDPEKTMAKVVNGVLTVTLTKVPEVQPKQITIKAE